MGLFTNEPGQVMMFLAQVLFIVLQIVILMRLTMEMNESSRGEARTATVSRTKRKIKRRR